MSSLFDDEDDLLVEETFVDTKAVIATSESSNLDARRRLEKMLDEKRLQYELDDFIDY